MSSLWSPAEAHLSALPWKQVVLFRLQQVPYQPLHQVLGSQQFFGSTMGPSSYSREHCLSRHKAFWDAEAADRVQMTEMGGHVLKKDEKC